MFYRIIAMAVVFIVVISGVSASDAIPQCELDVDCDSDIWGLDDKTIQSFDISKTHSVADHTIVFDRKYRRVNNAVQIFDSPGGQQVDELQQGFNFFTAMNEVDGWTQIASDRWVVSSSLTMDVNTSTFSGVYLSDDVMQYPLAWILVNLYPSRFPGGQPSERNEKIWRYTSVHIFSTVQVDGWNWYQIGIDQWVKQTQVARILPIDQPETVDGDLWISIDLYEQVLVVYEDHKPIYATLVSSGMEGWETNEGTFEIYLKYNRTLMTGGAVDDFYYLQEVPWTMYFDGDIALHGAYWHDGFGYRRSHGCVNLSVMDAYLLYQWASADSVDGPVFVHVYSSGQYR